MHKNWFVYIAVLILTGLLTAAAGLITVTAFIYAAAAYIAAMIWWTIYYYNLKYLAVDNTICITSGIIFMRTRIVPSSNILWAMSVKLPFSKRAFLTKLHTSGRAIVIFADFSTEC